MSSILAEIDVANNILTENDNIGVWGDGSWITDQNTC